MNIVVTWRYSIYVLDGRWDVKRKRSLWKVAEKGVRGQRERETEAEAESAEEEEEEVGESDGMEEK